MEDPNAVVGLEPCEFGQLLHNMVQPLRILVGDLQIFARFGIAKNGVYAVISTEGQILGSERDDVGRVLLLLNQFRYEFGKSRQVGDWF